MPVDHNASQRGGPPTFYPMPNPPVPAQDMTGIGKVPITPPEEDTTVHPSVVEQQRRAAAYRKPNS